MNTKKINLPIAMTQNQVEIVGIMFGDGNITIRNNTYVINITFNSKKDLEYIDYIKKLFFDEFQVILKTYTYPNKNAIILYFHSKVLVEYFIDILQIPLSPKKLDHIPTYILSNKLFLKSFIRGVFDTDGCVTFQKQGRYNYILIKICTANNIFAEDIKKALGILKIKSFICFKNSKFGIGYDIVVRNKNADMFINFVGSSNFRNIKKWGYRDLNSRDNAKSHYLP